MGCFELFDESSILVLSDEIRGDEARAAVNLCNFICEHVSIVVVASHAEATPGPADNLHSCGITDEVNQFSTRLVEETRCQELLLELSIKDLLHALPESFLPLEDCLFGHHIRHDIGLQAACEENASQVLDVVQRIVVNHHGRFIVHQLTAIHDDWLQLRVLWPVSCEHLALAHCLPAGTILSANGVALEKHRALEAELDAWNVDCVSGDGDTIPAPSHCSIW
mmetsp:Transcript_106173/g.188816  ORF Transcript_106173/g.188816 Transcript_106173/m.188816 type:complete len:223 (+) Transcript_106173:683-1351(+)